MTCTCDTDGFCWACREVDDTQRVVPVVYVIESDGDMDHGPSRERPPYPN